MNISFSRLLELLIIVGPFTALLLGCIAYGGGGYGYGNDALVSGPGYYEPYGTYYGGWGPNYYVAPYRNGGYSRPSRGESQPAAHAFRSSPASHTTPSIPSEQRSDSSWHR